MFSFLLFVLSCARLNYTLTLDPRDGLNGGRRFYGSSSLLLTQSVDTIGSTLTELFIADPVIAELLFTTLITMPWAGFMIFSIHKRYENKFVSKFRDEMIGLSIIWLFWMVGTGIATVRIASLFLVSLLPNIFPSFYITNSSLNVRTDHFLQSMWSNLAGCQQYNACRVLSALLAFAWLGWIVLTALFGICLLFTIANHAFLEPLHGRWDPRQTVYA